MTQNKLEDWATPVRDTASVLGWECKYCAALCEDSELKKFFIALPWLSPKEAKSVLSRLKKSLKPGIKVFPSYSVLEGLRGALDGLLFYPVERSEGVITLEPYRAGVVDTTKSMVLDAERDGRKIGILYDDDLYPRIVTVEKAFKWGFIAKTEDGFKSFRWEKIQPGPEGWYPTHGRSKYRFGVHVMATVARPHDRCESSRYGLM